MTEMAKNIDKPAYTHGDCAHARDFHDIGAYGQPILCKCDYFKYNMLIRDNACREHFKLKKK